MRCRLCTARDKAGEAGRETPLRKVFEGGDEAAAQRDVRGSVGVRVGGREGRVQGGGDVHCAGACCAGGAGGVFWGVVGLYLLVGGVLFYWWGVFRPYVVFVCTPGCTQYI